MIFEWNVDIAPWLTSTGVWIVATQGKPHSEKCLRELYSFASSQQMFEEICSIW